MITVHLDFVIGIKFVCVSNELVGPKACSSSEFVYAVLDPIIVPITDGYTILKVYC